jgi:hypothetical protein
MSFIVKIDPEAIADIQSAIECYNEQREFLGSIFLHELNDHIEQLRSNPYYQIRYLEVRCLPLRRFPFMIHYTLEPERNLVVI